MHDFILISLLEGLLEGIFQLKPEYLQIEVEQVFIHKVEGFEVDELYSLIHETELQQIVTDETLSLLLETHDLEIETDDDIV